MPNGHIPVKNKYSRAALAKNAKIGYPSRMKNIARLRKIKGWTQTDLAQVCGINQATVSKAEKGDGGVSLMIYEKIANSLDAPLHVIFSPDMEEVELKLVMVFRGLSKERQQGWMDILNGAVEFPQTPNR